jgi:hypothetical protein
MLSRALCSSLLARYQGSCRRISILRGLRTSWRQEIAQASLALVTPCISFHYAPRPTCRGSASLYVPPLSYKREDTQCYKADQLRRNSSSQAHKFSRRNSDTQYNTQWSMVLCSSGLNHSKLLCALVFSSTI